MKILIPALSFLLLAGASVSFYYDYTDFRGWVALVGSVLGFVKSFQKEKKNHRIIIPRIVKREKEFMLEIENPNDYDISDFILEFLPRKGMGNPFFDSDLVDSKLTIGNIISGQIVSKLMPITMDDGNEFDFRWSWKRDDGKSESKQSAVRISR